MEVSRFFLASSGGVEARSTVGEAPGPLEAPGVIRFERGGDSGSSGRWGPERSERVWDQCTQWKTIAMDSEKPLVCRGKQSFRGAIPRFHVRVG